MSGECGSTQEERGDGRKTVSLNDKTQIRTDTRVKPNVDLTAYFCLKAQGITGQ